MRNFQLFTISVIFFENITPLFEIIIVHFASVFTYLGTFSKYLTNYLSVFYIICTFT